MQRGWWKRNTLIQHLVRNTDLGRRYSVSRLTAGGGALSWIHNGWSYTRGKCWHTSHPSNLRQTSVGALPSRRVRGQSGCGATARQRTLRMCSDKQRRFKKHGRQSPLRHNSGVFFFCLNFCRTDVINISVRLHCCVLNTALYHHFCCPHRRHDEGGELRLPRLLSTWNPGMDQIVMHRLWQAFKSEPPSLCFIFSPIATHPHLHRLVWFLKVLFLVYNRPPQGEGVAD